MRRHRAHNLNFWALSKLYVTRTVTDLHEPKMTMTQLRDITRLYIYRNIICPPFAYNIICVNKSTE